MTFGQMIRNERLSRGLSIKALATKMGVGTSYVRQYECEARQPKIETIIKFGAGLGMSKREMKKLISTQVEEAIAEGKKNNVRMQ